MKKISNESVAGMPLNKYISIAGICSRRNAVLLIKDGHVKINGKVVKEPGVRVGSDDVVKVKNRVIHSQEHVYVVLNKPRGVVTTVSDEKGRPTVMDLITLARKQRIYPVGRLDVNTTGVLILTNDGDLAQKLAHPKGRISKVYDVTVHKALPPEAPDAIKAGIRIDGAVLQVDDCHLLQSPKNNKIRVTIHSGKNRIIRRLFEVLGYIVERLDRVDFAGISKKGLALGQWRVLKKSEIARLKSVS